MHRMPVEIMAWHHRTVEMGMEMEMVSMVAAFHRMAEEFHKMEMANSHNSLSSRNNHPLASFRMKM